METWRILLYPLGFCASLLFAARFVIQWISSEKRRQCHVPSVFWKLSFLGSLLFSVHGLIQVQFHLSLLQACNCVFSWRNLNLRKEGPQRATKRQVYGRLFLVVACVVALFVLQGQLAYGHSKWVRTPTLPWQEGPAEKLSLAWHLLGSLGLFLFSSRFWIQWWHAEKTRSHRLTPIFWWMTLSGALLSLAYFLRMGDAVNILGQGMSLFPAIRNLQLIRQEKKGKTPFKTPVKTETPHSHEPLETSKETSL